MWPDSTCSSSPSFLCNTSESSGQIRQLERVVKQIWHWNVAAVLQVATGENNLCTVKMPVLFRVHGFSRLTLNSFCFLSLLQRGSGRRLLWQQRDQRRCLPADLFAVQCQPHAGRSGESGRWHCRIIHNALCLCYRPSGKFECFLGFHWLDKPVINQ